MLGIIRCPLLFAQQRKDLEALQLWLCSSRAFSRQHLRLCRGPEVRQDVTLAGLQSPKDPA